MGKEKEEEEKTKKIILSISSLYCMRPFIVKKAIILLKVGAPGRTEYKSKSSACQ